MYYLQLIKLSSNALHRFRYEPFFMYQRFLKIYQGSQFLSSLDILFRRIPKDIHNNISPSIIWSTWKERFDKVLKMWIEIFKKFFKKKLNQRPIYSWDRTQAKGHIHIGLTIRYSFIGELGVIVKLMSLGKSLKLELYEEASLHYIPNQMAFI